MKGIRVQQGLNQGDLLTPFLFLLVAEGFSGVMANVVQRNLLKGFEVKRGELLFHISNMWTILFI